MPIQKIGVVHKIKTLATNEQEFEQLKNKIISNNNLIRCNKCGKLLAKSDSNLVSLKRKDIDIIANVNSISIKCPICSTCNNVCLEDRMEK